jgi:hypothetical protein
MKHLLPADIDYSILPEHLTGGMKRYLEHGILPGHFLQACLKNDLREAVGRVDQITDLRQVCLFLYNEAPAPSHGSEEKMIQWTKDQQEEAA